MPDATYFYTTNIVSTVTSTISFMGREEVMPFSE